MSFSLSAAPAASTPPCGPSFPPPTLWDHPGTPAWLADCSQPQHCTTRLTSDTAFGAFIGDAPIGTILIAADDGHIRATYVKAGFQGAGIGAA